MGEGVKGRGGRVKGRGGLSGGVAEGKVGVGRVG